jgi:hypothetical protein
MIHVTTIRTRRPRRQRRSTRIGAIQTNTVLVVREPELRGGRYFIFIHAQEFELKLK